MPLPTQSKRLCIYIGENQKSGNKPIYELIILQALEAGLAGATALRGPMGFGSDHRIHTNKILQLSLDLPMIVEIVECEEKIRAFLPTIEPLIDHGLVTLEDVTVLLHKPKH